MAGETVPWWARTRTSIQNFFEEKGIESDERFHRSSLLQSAHFGLLVAKSFFRNRCHVRASALAYTTLLALVPLLAVVMSVTTGVLQKQGREPVDRAINQLVGYIAPALNLETRTEEGGGQSGREKVVAQITAYISRINTGTLGTIGVLALLFAIISLLRTIEAAVNDIWGVTQGRGWLKSIVYYWAATTLGPVCMIAAITLTTGSYFETTRAWIDAVPFLGKIFFYALPFVLLSLGFAVFYALMPNTKVRWSAAFIGGTIGGCLWQLNNLGSVFYLSRVQTYRSIYGSLALVPLFLVGLYFSWLILLFGAQIAYAFQNRRAYLEERLGESVHQRGREFIALRLMTHLARNFAAGRRPLSLFELSRDLAVPGRLAQKILGTLAQSGLVVEVSDGETRFSPGRPLDRISAYDVINTLRTSHGQELAMTDDESHGKVRAEFERMMQAEYEAGAAITLQSLAELTAKQIGDTPRATLSGPKG